MERKHQRGTISRQETERGAGRRHGLTGDNNRDDNYVPLFIAFVLLLQAEEHFLIRHLCGETQGRLLEYR